MRTLSRLMITSVALAALMVPFASLSAQAQTCPATGCTHPPVSNVLNEQLQFGDVFADMQVVMHGSGSVAAGSAAGYGNVAAAPIGRGNATVSSTQTMTGQTAVRSTVTTGGSVGTIVNTATGYANAVSAGTTQGELAYRAGQTSSGDVRVEAGTYAVNAGMISTAASAAANVSAVSGENATVRNFVDQRSNGSVIARGLTEACCTGYGATTVSSAVGNASSSTSAASTSFNGAVQVTARGEEITAYSGYRSPQANGSTIAAASAAGNTVSVQNTYGYATLGRPGSNVYQEQNSAVSATSAVVIDQWSGLASSSAYGVGNSALISNVGSDTQLVALQINSGAISSNASLSGDTYTGGTGLVSSVAIGNAASAYVCSVCSSAGLQGNIQQVNGASVTAFGSLSTPVGGHVIGSAVAVGNTATFQSTAPGH
jgi:hypothetical protein